MTSASMPLPGSTSSADNLPAPNRSAENLTLPLHAEQLSVTRRQVAGDTVRVATVTRQQEHLVEETLTHERVEIERVPIDRAVDRVPPVREEGDTTVISVVEEVVVVERRLILKEEVRIKRVRVTENHRETVMLREQDAVITRTEAGSSAIPEGSPALGMKPTELA